MQAIEPFLLEKGDEYVQAVIASQQSKGLRASGYSAKSLRTVVSTEGRVYKLQLLGAAYFYQQQNGRRPSAKRPSRAMVASIKEWLKIRGLDIPAYAVAMKIQRDGIQVPNRFNPGGVLSEPLAIDKVRSGLKVAIRPILIQSAKSSLFS